MVSMSKMNEKGSVSLITVLFLTTLLTLLAVSSLRLMVRERTNATNVQLTAQAFYAAESGVEDAKRAIQGYLDGDASVSLNGSDCKPASWSTRIYDHDSSNGNTPTDEVELDDSGTTGYTCQLIDIDPEEYIRQVSENETVQLKLDPQGAQENEVDKVLIEWHVEGDPSDPDPATDDGASVARDGSQHDTVPGKACWDHPGGGVGCPDGTGPGYPAMLKLGVFAHPYNDATSGTFDRSRVRGDIGYLNPSHTGTGSVDIFRLSTDNPSFRRMIPNTDSNEGPHCEQAATIGDYRCSVEVTNLRGGHNNLAYTLQITSIYRSTRLKITMYDQGGNVLGFEGVQAVIDVTGRAADLFRRIKTVVNLENDAIVPASALTVADDICKLIVDRGNGFEDNCPTP